MSGTLGSSSDSDNNLVKQTFRQDRNEFRTATDFIKILTLQVPETKLAEFAYSVDLGEVAHHEPPHLDLHCLPSCL